MFLCCLNYQWVPCSTKSLLLWSQTILHHNKMFPVMTVFAVPAAILIFHLGTSQWHSGSLISESMFQSPLVLSCPGPRSDVCLLCIMSPLRSLFLRLMIMPLTLFSTSPLQLSQSMVDLISHQNSVPLSFSSQYSIFNCNWSSGPESSKNEYFCIILHIFLCRLVAQLRSEGGAEGKDNH